jgi:hypothetical protein
MSGGFFQTVPREGEMNIALLLGALIAAVLFVGERETLIYEIRTQAFAQDPMAVYTGPSYWLMFFDVRKWTLRGFYPGV